MDDAIEPDDGMGWDSGDEAAGPPEENAFRDELNLAEFPIAALTDRVPDGQTTLVFEDKLERRDSPPIVRRLTIMGTHKHGLPTADPKEIDADVILVRADGKSRCGYPCCLEA